MNPARTRRSLLLPLANLVAVAFVLGQPAAARAQCTT